MACSYAIGRIAKEIRELIRQLLFIDTVAETYMEISDKTNNLWSFHDDHIKIKIINAVKRHKDEMLTNLKYYLDQLMIDRKENPICYWINLASVYPTLIVSVITKKILRIVRTSVSSERLFSRTGNILTDSRN